MRRAMSPPIRRSAPRWTRCEGDSTVGCGRLTIPYCKVLSRRQKAQRRTIPTESRRVRSRKLYETNHSLCGLWSVDGADVAGIGGLMATAMKFRGLAGAVIDASIRDTPQI